MKLGRRSLLQALGVTPLLLALSGRAGHAAAPVATHEVPRGPTVFGFMWPVAHNRTDDSGERVRDGATTGTWPATNTFYRVVFDAYPDIVRREGDEIIVSMLNGIGRYRITGERIDHDGAPVIDAVLVHLDVSPPESWG